MAKPVDKNKPIPLYLQCANVIAERIQNKRYGVGDFIPPERELCKEFNVARLTIRRSLAELVRSGLLERVPGAGTRVVERKRKSAATRSICCVTVRNVRPLSLSPFYADIFSGVEKELAGTSFHLVFAAFEKNELWDEQGGARAQAARVRAAQLAKRSGFSGVLFIDGIPDEFVLAIHQYGIPLVLTDKQMAHPCISSVMPDNFAGAQEAARYLLDLGHRRIAFLAAPKDPVVEARFEGFLEAHREAGIKFEQRLYLAGGYEILPAFDAMTAFLKSCRKKDLPTAVMAVNDEAAIGALKALQKHGLRVPADVSVIGFDDISWSAHTEPPLTTVRIMREEMGRLATKLLLRQIETKNAPAAKLLMHTELVARDSCAKPASR